MNDILTVGLPLYNSKFQYKTAINSLIKQKGIDFKWELVIIEESNNNAVGRLALFRYSKKLYELGCNKIFHVPIKKKMPESMKWHKIAKLADKNSKCIVLQYDYINSKDNRLKKTYDSFKNDIECVESKDGYAVRTDILKDMFDCIFIKIDSLKKKKI